MQTLDDIKDLVLRMEDLCHEAGLTRFDRVRLVSGAQGEPDEVWFVWDETDDDDQRVVAITLDGDRPEDVTDAMAHAAAGDPVLN